MLRTIRGIAESYIFILLLSLIVGLFIPQARFLVVLNTFFLQVIFFLSILKINFREVILHVKDWRLLTFTSLIMLLVLPFVVYAIANLIVPDLAFPLFLLAAMPAGMTSPLQVEVIGGKVSLALVLTMIMSLLAPITIPLITRLTYETSIPVDTFEMLKTLALVIFIPFVLAEIFKRLAPNITARYAKRTKTISIALLGLLVAGAVANQAYAVLIYARSGWGIIRTIVVLFVFFACLHVIGYWVAWWKPYAERRTVTVCFVYMNFTLAIYLATKFFTSPEVLLPLVLSILPWSTMLPVWKKISNKNKLN